MASSLIKFASASLVVFTQYAAAADFTFSGNIRYHNDVVRVDFTLNTEATDVRVWTDSFNDGENFDPITAVWTLPTGALVGENDDDDTIGPNQTYFDSGLTFASLPAGSTHSPSRPTTTSLLTTCSSHLGMRTRHQYRSGPGASPRLTTA